MDLEAEATSSEETPRIDSFEKDISNLKSDILARRHFDSLVTARL